MKTRFVPQTVVCCLLAVSLCLWAWQSTSAGGPPVRLAVLVAQPADHFTDSSENPDRRVPDLNSVTELIPTTWKPNSQLIPTDIEARSLLVQRELPDGTYRTETTQPAQQGEINAFLNQQIFSLTPRNASSPPAVGTWVSPARVTRGTRVATVPKSIGRRRQTATDPSPEEIPQQK